ncbi:MAG: AI-2E family transporter [Acidimicrobiales bacterium]
MLLPRGLSVLLTVAAAMIVIAGLRSFASSIGPIFLALVIVVVVSPLQRALTNRGAPAWLGMTALLIACFGVLGSIVIALVWSTTQLVGLLASDDYATKLADAQQQVADQLTDIGVSGNDLTEALAGLDLGAVAGRVTSALSGLLGLTSAISLLMIAMLFMVLDSEKFAASLDAVTEDRPNVVNGLQQFAQRTRSYFVVSTIFGLIVAVLDVAALVALGIPLAAVWGVLSLITNYIPNIGFVIGLVPPAILAFFEGGWRLSVWVIVIYFVINVIVQSVIQPRFVGDAVGLSATLTFLSLIFWGWVLGPLGALLAVPMTLLAKALLVDIDPATQWAAPLISLGVPRPLDAVADVLDERDDSAGGAETGAGSDRRADAGVGVAGGSDDGVDGEVTEPAERSLTPTELEAHRRAAAEAAKRNRN